MENNNSRIKLRLCQMDIKPNDPDFNALFLVDNLTQAKADGIDLVCAPEMCLSGFDWQQNVELSDQIQNALLTIRNTVKSSGVGFCGSFYRKNPITPPPILQFYGFRQGRVLKNIGMTKYTFFADG